MHAQLRNVENALSTIANISSPYLNLVHEFPSACIVRSSLEYSNRPITFMNRNHIGAKSIINSITFTIRGYIKTSLEDSLEDSEVLARQIEEVLQNTTFPSLINLRVMSVETDEGLISPYGMCILVCRLDYIDE